MKFLIDIPVSPLVISVLKSYGHEGIHAFQIEKGCASDEELLEIARNEKRIIITADLDFPRILALTYADGPGVILFRGGNYSNSEMMELIERVLKEVRIEILVNSICVVDKKRIRITQLPIGHN